MIYLFYLSGIFTFVLGVIHFFMPIILDFKSAIPLKGEALQPINLSFYQYDTTRSDVYGLAWVMNYAVSYTLVTIGLTDLSIGKWMYSEFSKIIFLWIAVWWFLRAACQFYL